MPSERLSIDVHGDHVMAVSGELELATAPQLQACIQNLHSEHNRHLQIDLSGTTFCDSTGIGTLAWACDTLGAGEQPVLIHPSQHLPESSP